MDVSRLKPYPGNPRDHGDDIEWIVKSMQKFGWTNPILAQKGTGRILAGHGRVLAAKKAGIAKVPVIYLDMNDQDAAAYTIADNKLAERSGWNFGLLREQIVALDDGAFDLTVTGFDLDEIQDMMGSGGDGSDPKEDEVPAIGDGAAFVKPGQVWQMGDHRMICGDATREADVARLFGAASGKMAEIPERASMCWTDPPYGVSYEARSGKFEVIEGDRSQGDKLLRLIADSMGRAADATEAEAAFYVFHASSTREDFAAGLKAAGLMERQYLTWVKPGITLGHSDYRYNSEPFFYHSKAGVRPAFYGDRAEPTVWRIAQHSAGKVATVIGPGILVRDGRGHALYIGAKEPKGKKVRAIRVGEGIEAILDASGAEGDHGTVWEVGHDSGGNAQHPTQKPVALAQRAIENSSRIGQIIYDPFLGSGTAIIAAEKTGRRAYGCELDPKYASVIVKRFEAFSGKKAVLVEADETAAQEARQ